MRANRPETALYGEELVIGDICRRYVGARLRTAYAYLEAEPLPHEHVARLASR